MGRKSPLHRRETNGAYKLLNSIQETAPPVPAVTGVPRSTKRKIKMGSSGIPKEPQKKSKIR